MRAASSGDAETTVIVVGAGLAGLVTACRALELGEDVVVLEAGSDADYRCNSRISGGVFHVAHHPTDEAPESLLVALEKGTFGGADPELARLLVGGIERALSWLESKGARFERVSEMNLRALTPYNWGGELGGGPDLFLAKLRDAFTAGGGRIRFGHRVTSLVAREARITGVRVETAEGEEELLAKAVVFADGGFQNNLELVARHIAPKPDMVVRRNGGGSHGTALSLCAGHGAKLVHLDSFYGHLVSVDGLTNDRLSRYPAIDGLAAGGLLVDRAGKRFCDEGLGGVHMANMLARRSDPQAFAICDVRAWEQSLKGNATTPSSNPELEKRGGTVHRANTLGELAALAGLPQDELTATIDEINRFAAGAIAGLPIEKTLHPAWDGVREAPFFAVPVLAGLTFTMGGPLIDRHARALTEDGAHIDGLYVVGSAAGGFDGGTERVGYAGGLSRSAVTGLAAAEHIARAAA